MRHAFHLHPIRAWMPMPRISQTMLERAVAREQQQALTVAIQPACRINVLNRDEILQRARPGELAQDIVRFVEQNVTVGQGQHHTLRGASLEACATVVIETPCEFFSTVEKAALARPAWPRRPA